MESNTLVAHNNVVNTISVFFISFIKFIFNKTLTVGWVVSSFVCGLDANAMLLQVFRFIYFFDRFVCFFSKNLFLICKIIIIWNTLFGDETTKKFFCRDNYRIDRGEVVLSEYNHTWNRVVVVVLLRKRIGTLCRSLLQLAHWIGVEIHRFRSESIYRCQQKLDYHHRL